jgi:hypothetical protein
MSPHNAALRCFCCTLPCTCVYAHTCSTPPPLLAAHCTPSLLPAHFIPMPHTPRKAADYKLSLGRPGLQGADREAALRACHQRSADRLLQLCFANGGIYTKLGQHIGQLVREPPTLCTAAGAVAAAVNKHRAI